MITKKINGLALAFGIAAGCQLARERNISSIEADARQPSR
jgi:hypothetical protein